MHSFMSAQKLGGSRSDSDLVEELRIWGVRMSLTIDRLRVK